MASFETRNERKIPRQIPCNNCLMLTRAVREPGLDQLGTMDLSRARTGIERANATFWELVTRKETTRDQVLAKNG